MYVRTPKRYRGAMRRSTLPCGRLMLYSLALTAIIMGIGIYQNRDAVQPIVSREVNRVVAMMDEGIATLTAPTPTPTPNPENNLIQGDNFWVRGSAGEALRVYNTVISALPNDLQTHYRVTLGHILQGSYDRAVEAGERTVTANPFSSDAWAIRGWALDWAGRADEAIISNLHALDINPDNARAMAFLAEAYLTTNNPSLARTWAERAVEANPDSIEAYRARGHIKHYGSLDFAGALDDLRTAYDIALDANPALASLVAIDIAQIEVLRFGNYEAGIDILESVLEINPDSTQALYMLGTTYYGQVGDNNQAIGPLQRCTEIDPQTVDCYYYLGRAQERLEQIDAALQSFEQAVRNGSGNPYHFWWAGRTNISLGNCSRGLEYLRPGYDLAVEFGDATLLDNYDYAFGLCQASPRAPQPRNQPTPQPTFAPEGSI